MNYYTNLMTTKMRWFTAVKWLSLAGLFLSIISLLSVTELIPILYMILVIALHFLVIFGLGSMQWWGAVSFFILYLIKSLSGICSLILYGRENFAYYAFMLTVYLILLIPTYPYMKKRRLFFDPVPKHLPEEILEEFEYYEEYNSKTYRNSVTFND